MAIGPIGLLFFKLVTENEQVFSAISQQFVEGLVRAYVRSVTAKPSARKSKIRSPRNGCLVAIADLKGFFSFKEPIQAHNRKTSDIEGSYGGVGAKVPIKIIWGADDAWLPMEIAQKLNEALNADEMVIVEGAGHLIHYDQPSALALDLGLWLEKHG